MAEQRLIDANGSYTLNASDNTDYSLCFGGGIISAIDKHGHIVCEFLADEAPTIDAEPVRHGHWVEEPFLLGTTHRCNFCGENYGMPHGIYNYCPNCGAKMDEEVNRG